MIFSLFVLSFICATLASPAVETSQPYAEIAANVLAEDTKGDNRYNVFGKANWFMALQVCASKNMRLVRINDQNKNDEVTYFIDKTAALSGPYWTLANKLYDETTWAFAVGDPVKYFNWAAGQPDNARGNEKCIEIYKNGQWNDQTCSDERFVLCESMSN